MTEDYVAGVPELVKASLIRYVRDGVPTGDFLQAVLENDLREAFNRADHQNRYRMFEIVCFCWNKLPSLCWGNRERVKAWLALECQERVDLLRGWSCEENT